MENKEKLEHQKCCYTCMNNRNALRYDFKCNCEFENRVEYTNQDMRCEDYNSII